MVIESVCRFADGIDIRPGLNKRLTDCVNPVFRRKFQPLPVAIGESTDTEIDSWQVEPFARPEFTADLDTTPHVFPFDLHDLKLDKSIV